MTINKASADWAEAHWSPLTGEGTELTQFNIWHHRRFGFVDHREAVCANRFLVWQASRAAVVVELPSEDGEDGESWDACWKAGVIRCREAIEAAGLKVKP